MKAEEVHNMSDAELVEELGRTRRHLYDLKAQTVTEKLEDPTQITKTRRYIAQMLTEQRARQLAKQAKVNS